MNVLVLGGNGFIGKNLVKELTNSNYNVTSFDLNLPVQRVEGVNYIQGNFFDEAMLDYLTENIGVIFHGISSINPGNSNQKYITINEDQLDIILNGGEISTRPKRGIIDIEHRF